MSGSLEKKVNLDPDEGPLQGWHIGFLELYLLIGGIGMVLGVTFHYSRAAWLPILANRHTALLGESAPAMHHNLLLMGVAFGLLYLSYLKWFGGRGVWIGGFLVGLMTGSAGWYPLSTSIIPGWPMPDWDIWLMGVEAHRNAFMHSSVAPVCLLLICLWSARGRSLAIGLCVGVASHLVADFFSTAYEVLEYEVIPMESLSSPLLVDTNLFVAICWLFANTVILLAAAGVAGPGVKRFQTTLEKGTL